MGVLALLANLAPAVLPLFSKNETVQKAGEIVSTTARAITGADDDRAALDALKADPELLLQYQRAVADETITLYQEETKRLETINETARQDSKSEDPYVRRARPTAVYTVVASVIVLMAAFAWTIVVSPGDAGTVAAAIVQISVLLTPLMAIAGVYVYRRSDEKMKGVAASSSGFDKIGKIFAGAKEAISP